MKAKLYSSSDRLAAFNEAQQFKNPYNKQLNRTGSLFIVIRASFYQRGCVMVFTGRAVGLISEASSDVRENRLPPCCGHAYGSLYPWPACVLRASGACVAAKQHQAKQQPVIDDV